MIPSPSWTKFRALRAVVVAGVMIAATALAQNNPPASNRPASNPTHNFERWEKAIAAFEAKDKTNPPPKGALLFIGSSTIVKWKTLAEDFPDQKVINRGFGGSELVDSTHFADRIVIPYQPKMVMLRAGSNDIAAGHSPEQVFNDFKDFAATVHADLPDCVVVYTGLNATPSRWKNHEKEIAANAMIGKFASETKNVKYIDTYDVALGPDGMPIEALFADRLHFNAEGYKLLAARVREWLAKNAAASKPAG